MQFIDEVLFRQEEDLYEVCRDRVDQILLNFDRYYYTKRERPAVKKHLELQQALLHGGPREEFLTVLEQRRQKILGTLSRKAGIE